MAPSASKLKKLKAALDCCVVDVQEYSADPHAIAGGCPQSLGRMVPCAVEAPGKGKHGECVTMCQTLESLAS